MKHFVFQESASTVPQVMPAANETNGFSPSSSFLPKNDYEDIIAFLTDDNENSQQEQARKKSKTLATTSGDEDSLSYLFQLDQPVSLEEILGQGKTLPSEPHLGGSSSSHYVAPQTVITNTRSTIQLNPNSSERIDISVSTGIIVPNASNSTFSLPQNNPKFWPAGSNAFYAPETGTSFADSIFPKTTRYSFTQFESPSFPVQPYGCAGASASGLVGNYETQLQSPSLVHPYAGPSVGSGVAANNLDGNSLTQFQSPRLTEWPSTMKVAVYVPRKAVINTMRLYGGPIDYILFEVTEFGNLDLYGRLMTEKKDTIIVEHL
ncbi:hypothetical protein LR48_Vigan01g142000 [Vigna angularis]|uniref:Uncharacterized protein n=1 Tax=Phaseolus angularis TaxID=3914 RepID=A0A0L9TNX2_PHAAN|nr:hypothetical protein LR48_Vigan01g142000 [Vigna angularis]